METPTTTVKLISRTSFPMETLWLVWQASRTEMELPDARELNGVLTAQGSWICGESGQRFTTQDVADLACRLLRDGLPVLEMVEVVLLLENVPIALREQLVRHRVGHKFGPELGVDMIPELAGDSTFWTQTMRVRDMRNFHSRGQYSTPEAIEQDEDAAARYHACMERIEFEYGELLDLGVEIQDARNVLPMGMTHRMTWRTNLMALRHLIGKRTCWIAQLGMWEPVVLGVIKVLAETIHPSLADWVNPPCIGTGDCYSKCDYHEENWARIEGRDPYPPCPMYVFNNRGDAAQASGRAKPDSGWVVNSGELDPKNSNEAAPFRRMKERYAKLWGRNAKTGERIALPVLQ